MTDPTPPRVTVCEVEDCHVLIPATTEDRRAHRRGHDHDRKVFDANLRANRDRDATIRALTQQFAELSEKCSDLAQQLANLEIPEPVDPFAIVAPDELEPLDDEDDYEQQSQYAEESLTGAALYDHNEDEDETPTPSALDSYFTPRS